MKCICLLLQLFEGERKGIIAPSRLEPISYHVSIMLCMSTKFFDTRNFLNENNRKSMLLLTDNRA